MGHLVGHFVRHVPVGSSVGHVSSDSFVGKVPVVSSVSPVPVGFCVGPVPVGPSVGQGFVGFSVGHVSGGPGDVSSDGFVLGDCGGHVHLVLGGSGVDDPGNNVGGVAGTFVDQYTHL